VWAYAFVAGRTYDGRAFKMLTLVDEFTRECSLIEVDQRLTYNRVAGVLDRVSRKCGAKEKIENWRRHSNEDRPHSALGQPEPQGVRCEPSPGMRGRMKRKPHMRLVLNREQSH